MGAVMIIKAEIIPEYLAFVMNEIKLNTIQNYLDDTMIVYFEGYLGYAEPVEMYDKLKDYVKDIWYLCISDEMAKVGKNHPTQWRSAKKELIADLK